MIDGKLCCRLSLSFAASLFAGVVLGLEGTFIVLEFSPHNKERMLWKSRTCVVSFISISVIGLIVTFLFESIVLLRPTWISASQKPSQVVRQANNKIYYEVGDRPNLKYIPGILEAFRLKKLTNPKCLGSGANSTTWWRSTKTDDVFSAEDDYNRMVLAATCGGHFDKNFFTTPPHERMYSFEQEFLADPPLSNYATVISEDKTTVELYNKSASFKLGDSLEVLIRARDWNGKPRSKGGDVIRAWLESPDGSNAVAANVIDFKNGTYLAVSPLPWTGQYKVLVSLAYPREYKRAVAFLQQTIKGFHQTVVRFENDKAGEATPCYHAPVVPGFSVQELCNLTAINGSPFYCGHPLKKSLSCADARFSRNLDITTYFPLTAAEMALLQRTLENPRLRIVSSSITANIPGNKDSRMVSPNIPCSKMDPAQTWKQADPTGYFYKGEWQPSSCTLHKPTMAKCLESKNIVFLGDSNARFHYDAITGILRCQHLLTRLREKWHAPLKCRNANLNTDVTWLPHSNPFLSYHDRWTKLEDLVSSSLFIDQLPSDSRETWLFLHHYVHLTSYHFSVFEVRFRAIKESVTRFLARQPNSRVVIQGPHVYWYGKKIHYSLGTQFATYLVELQRDIFKDISDKVFYIPVMDSSIAKRSSDTHPPHLGEVFKLVFQYFCHSNNNQKR